MRIEKIFSLFSFAVLFKIKCISLEAAKLNSLTAPQLVDTKSCNGPNATLKESTTRGSGEN